MSVIRENELSLGNVESTLLTLRWSDATYIVVQTEEDQSDSRTLIA